MRSPGISEAGRKASKSQSSTLDVRSWQLAARSLGAGFAFLAHRLYSLDHELQTVPAPLRVGDDLLDVEEEMGIAHFFAQFFEERMDLREDQEHLAAKCRLQEQLFIQNAQQNKRRRHVPVAGDLAKPVILLHSHRKGDTHDIVCALGEKFGSPPVARLAHFRFAAQFVEFQNQVGIGCGRLLGHGFLRFKWTLLEDLDARLRTQESKHFSLKHYAVVAAASDGGAARSKSHSLFGHAITGPAFRFFSTRYSLPQAGHFSAIGLCAEVNLQLG